MNYSSLVTLAVVVILNISLSVQDSVVTESPLQTENQSPPCESATRELIPFKETNEVSNAGFDRDRLYEDFTQTMSSSSQWGELLSEAPRAISALADIIVKLTDRSDFRLNGLNPEDSWLFKFRESLLEIINSGGDAFRQTRNKMENIQLRSLDVRRCVTETTYALIGKKPDVTGMTLPLSLQRAKEAAEKYMTLSREAASSFQRVANRTAELLKAVLVTKGVKEQMQGEINSQERKLRETLKNLNSSIESGESVSDGEVVDPEKKNELLRTQYSETLHALLLNLVEEKQNDEATRLLTESVENLGQLTEHWTSLLMYFQFMATPLHKRFNVEIQQFLDLAELGRNNTDILGNKNYRTQTYESAVRVAQATYYLESMAEFYINVTTNYLAPYLEKLGQMMSLDMNRITDSMVALRVEIMGFGITGPRSAWVAYKAEKDKVIVDQMNAYVEDLEKLL